MHSILNYEEELIMTLSCLSLTNTCLSFPNYTSQNIVTAVSLSFWAANSTPHVAEESFHLRNSESEQKD